MSGKLMGIGEIGRRYGVDRRQAHKWSMREDFPQPIERLAMGPIWRTSAIEKWAKKTGKEGDTVA